MNIPDPGWKGQPEPPAERDDGPCGVCGGLGYLPEQSYGCADIPDDFIPVQRCDACGMFASDEEAARQMAADVNLTLLPLVEVRWFEPDEFDRHSIYGLGDWAIGPMPTEHEENP